jgi:predicted nuclease with TOPRIM domain
MTEAMETKDVETRIAKLVKENRTLEENFHLVVGPYGNIGKKLKDFEKRISALEEQAAKKCTRAEARVTSPESKGKGS